MKIALVYDRVNKWGGAERVLLALHEMFPEAPLFTSVYDVKGAPWAKVFPKIHTSFLQKIPFAKTNHQLLSFLMPLAFESFDFDEYDLVISVTSEAAKGIITKPGTKHICYMLTPTRYLWSGYEDYFKNPVLRFIAAPIVNYLRKWDKIAAYRPDTIIAISTEVQRRVKKYYNRESNIVYPPANFKFKISNLNSNLKLKISNYYLVVSRLVPYKRVDIVVEAFNRLKYPLVIVGTGSEEFKLKLRAKKNIKFVGHVTDQELAGYYANCKALVFPQEEDFGLVAVEAQTFGKPVIAYRAGGALDIVIEGKTGIFFDDQSVESLIAVVKKFENLPADWRGMQFDSKIIVQNAERFSKERFRKEFLSLI